MTYLDAWGLVALAADEPAADEVEELLRAGGVRVVVVNLAEAVDVSRRVHDLSEEEVRGALEPLFAGGALTGVASAEEHGWHAADLRARHYDRRERPLSLADCFLLAHGALDHRAIATSDPALAAAARDELVELTPLRDSSGKRP